MASRRKKKEVPVTEEIKIVEENINKPEIETPTVKKTTIKKDTAPKKIQKFDIGALVFVNKDAEADLNGFCLFSQYKKDAYTVEAYDVVRGVYTLRRQKLLIKLKERDLVAPDENAHDVLNKKQF